MDKMRFALSFIFFIIFLVFFYGISFLCISLNGCVPPFVRFFGSLSVCPSVHPYVPHARIEFQSAAISGHFLLQNGIKSMKQRKTREQIMNVPTL